MTPAERTLGGVDLLLVHAELLLSSGSRTSPRARDRAMAAREARAKRSVGPSEATRCSKSARAPFLSDALGGPAMPNRAALAAPRARLERAPRRDERAFCLEHTSDPALRARGHLALSYYVVARHEATTSAGTASVVYGWTRGDRLPVREGYYGWSNLARRRLLCRSTRSRRSHARSSGRRSASRRGTRSQRRCPLAAELGRELAALLDEPTYATLRATAFACAPSNSRSCARADEGDAVGPWTDRRVGPGDVRRLQSGSARAQWSARVGPEEWERLRGGDPPHRAQARGLGGRGVDMGRRGRRGGARGPTPRGRRARAQARRQQPGARRSQRA